MTTRLSLTQAQIARAIRAAEVCGKVAVLTPAGIVFAQPGEVALPSPETGRDNTCDSAFGVAS